MRVCVCAWKETLPCPVSHVKSPTLPPTGGVLRTCRSTTLDQHAAPHTTHTQRSGNTRTHACIHTCMHSHAHVCVPCHVHTHAAHHVAPHVAPHVYPCTPHVVPHAGMHVQEQHAWACSASTSPTHRLHPHIIPHVQLHVHTHVYIHIHTCPTHVALRITRIPHATLHVLPITQHVQLHDVHVCSLFTCIS